MNLSHNEVEAMVKKASRGVGYEWGMAEEAAKAVRWLNTFDLKGCEAIAHLLTIIDETNSPLRQSFDIDGVWKIEGNTLCPLQAGTVLSDFAFHLTSRPIKMGSVHQPVLLIPFGVAAARQLGRLVAINWSSVCVVTDGNGLSFIGKIDDLYLPIADCMDVFVAAEMGRPISAISRVFPNDDAWDTLCTFAQRTYAPATEESRNRGAGGV